ncbi:MAG: hypothetical protein A2096_12165 [Spirochaetes bacterium GWF1_41_5]|nr:MAG: hypothetical protein A2096_12165 [Spirochaetes bacterium GWF1_41_5]HBE02416.1 hypothetical protein [Spirochaetia bacterium]
MYTKNLIFVILLYAAGTLTGATHTFQVYDEPKSVLLSAPKEMFRGSISAVIIYGENYNPAIAECILENCENENLGEREAWYRVIVTPLDFTVKNRSMKAALEFRDIEGSKITVRRTVPLIIQYRPVLICAITKPEAHSVVRADVPIFGLAYGDGFAAYKLFYRQADDESATNMLFFSTNTPQQQETFFKAMSQTYGSILGNLATWTTGLDEYTHSSKIDGSKWKRNLYGPYIVRLEVYSADGETLFDEREYEVGRVITSTAGGFIESREKRIKLAVDGFASIGTQNFVMYLDEIKKDFIEHLLPADMAAVLPVWEIRSPGFHSHENMTISFSNFEQATAEHSRLFAFDAKSNRWEAAHEEWIRRGSDTFLQLKNMEESWRLLGIFYSDNINTPQRDFSYSGEFPQGYVFPSAPAHNFLIYNDCAQKGFLRSYCGTNGAEITIIDEVTNKYAEFSLSQNKTMLAAELYGDHFNAKDFPYLGFRYRIKPDVRVDVFAFHSNAWYCFKLTDGNHGTWTGIKPVYTLEYAYDDDNWHQIFYNIYRGICESRGYADSADVIIERIIIADVNNSSCGNSSISTLFADAKYCLDDIFIGQGGENSSGSLDFTGCNVSYSFNGIDYIQGNFSAILPEMTSGYNRVLVRGIKDGGEFGPFGYALVKDPQILQINSDISIDNNPNLLAYFAAENISYNGVFMLSNDNGKGILTSPDNGILHEAESGSFAEIEFTAPTNRAYTVFWFAKGAHSGSDSFWVSLDNGSVKSINAPLVWGHQGVFVNSNLEAGTHKVRVMPREDGASLQYIGVATTHAYY